MYWSVWVGFLSTEISNVLSGPGEAKVSNKGMDPFLLGTFHELDMWVSGINLLQELQAVFCLFDDKDVICIPKPKPGWIGSSADGLGYKFLHEKIGYNRGTHGCAWTCS